MIINLMIEGCMFKSYLKKLNQYLGYVKRTLLFSSLVFLTSYNSNVSAEALTIGTGEFPPYVSEKQINGGPLSMLVVAAFEKSNYQVKFGFMPWNRALKSAQSTRLDGTFPWALNTEKQKVFLYSKPLLTFERLAFALKPVTIDLSDKALPKSINLCQSQGYSLLGLSKELIEKGTAVHFSPPNVETCFNMLKGGRVDIVVVDKLEGRNYVNKLFPNPDSVKTLKRVFHQYSNYLLISKKHPQGGLIMEGFNHGLDKIIKSREYQKILFDELGL